MGAAIGLLVVLLDAIAEFEILELLEKGEAAAPADPRFRQILRARGVGGRFLGAAESQIFAERGLLARHHDAHAGVAAARRDRRRAEQQAEQRDARHGFHALARSDRVTAHDVTEFVREHPLHLLGAVGGLDQSAEDIDILATRDEGVDAAVAEQMDLHLSGAQPRRDEQRVHHVLEQRLGLGIAQHRLRRRRARRNRDHREQCQQDAEQRAQSMRPKRGERRGSGHRRLSCAARLNID